MSIKNFLQYPGGWVIKEQTSQSMDPCSSPLLAIERVEHFEATESCWAIWNNNCQIDIWVNLTLTVIPLSFKTTGICALPTWKWGNVWRKISLSDYIHLCCKPSLKVEWLLKGPVLWCGDVTTKWVTVEGEWHFFVNNYFWSYLCCISRCRAGHFRHFWIFSIIKKLIILHFLSS